MLDFSEYVKKFEALDQKSKALIIVDVQEAFSKYIHDDYLDALFKYCENFERVYQIFDNRDQDAQSWDFPNQYNYCSKEYGPKPLAEWDNDDLSEVFHEIDLERNKALIADPTKGDFLVDKKNCIWLYVGNNHIWFKMEPELANMLTDLKIYDAEPIIVGGASEECLEDIIVACKYLGLRPQLEYKYIYSSTFCPKGI